MRITLLKSLLAGLCIAAAGSASAAPVNLVANGSFESGLAGWTASGTTLSNPAVAIFYGAALPYPNGAYGEAVPAPTNATASPDAAGSRGAYFVDDGSINESLGQSIFLAAGSYRIGFDVYAPNNGYANANDAMFSAQIAGIDLANYAVSTRPSVTWTNYSALVTIASSGFYSASFVFNTPNAGAAKDVVIDRVYVIATDETGGRVIPEPGSLALVGVALAGLVAVRRRKPS